jgi:predicted phosphodiesterase
LISSRTVILSDTHLGRLCRRDGVAVTMLAGNHDPDISAARHLTLGEILVTHGDVLHPAIAPWTPSAERIRAAHDRAVAALPDGHDLDLETMLRIFQQASRESTDFEEDASSTSILHMLLRPGAVLRVLRYWHRFARMAAAFAERHAPSARFVVMGHTHRGGIWNVDGRVIINTGSFGFPGRPRAVICEGGELSVRRIRRRGDTYAFADAPIATWTLQDAASSAETPDAPNTRPGSGAAPRPSRPSAAAT